ncbi:hypothetical protein OIU77_016468 [Salix suchowensis]|uniref:Uncharacterized protein n=1 Tax=Salix suchowensis TaxID=1278906 RepID=A0ABQ8ZKH0_9ROSI|nr:hypothetical protein OIU77_016468 [Salix suchowensis]
MDNKSLVFVSKNLQSKEEPQVFTNLILPNSRIFFPSQRQRAIVHLICPFGCIFYLVN